MKNKSITVDGVNLSLEFVSGFKTEAEFMAAMSEKTYSHHFEGDNREAKLKEVYALGTPKKEVVETKAEVEKKAVKPGK